MPFLRQVGTFFRDRFLGRLRMSFFAPKFIRFARDLRGLDEAADFLYSFRYLGIAVQPYQDKREIVDFMKLVEEITPETVIEVGTGAGGTLFLLTRASKPDAMLVTVDLPPSAVGIGYPKWKERLYLSFARDGQTISLVRGNSHEESTASLIREKLGNRQVDVLFIDGDHTYDGVKRDFDLYSPLVRKGGIVAFHDIVPHPIRKDIRVPEFWNEIRKRYRNTEIMKEPHRNGIGILYL
jgi:predicted O-methyltransferase YrrM